MPGEPSKTPDGGEAALHTLLIVEDDEAIGELLVQTIKTETPYAALLTIDAAQALHAVESLIPSLFILDYHLPGIDGLELHDRLHSTKALESVPTLMMSSHSPSPQSLRQRGITFLKKPFDLTAFLNAIEKMLPQNKSASSE
jgi:DNA-binding NtrC family response regulator